MLDRIRHLLSAPEMKNTRTAQVIAFESGGRARWTPRDYAALTREGYLKNAIVHRAVRLVAEAAASVPLLIYQGAAVFDQHALLSLLARPNPRQEGASLMEAVYAHLLLAGNAYLEAVTLADAVRELYVLRPDRMRVVPGTDGWPEAYDYTVGGRTVRFDQSTLPVPPILQLTFFNPLDDHYGLAPLEAAAVAVELTAFECPGFAIVLGHGLWTGAADIINGFASLSGLLIAYMGARFGVLGIYVAGRSFEKSKKGGSGEAGSLIGAVVKAVGKKK